MLFEIGMELKIGKHNKVIVLATITDIVGEKIIAYCTHYNKPYYLECKKEDINVDFEVLDYNIV
jgi:hypothetical protein